MEIYYTKFMVWIMIQRENYLFVFVQKLHNEIIKFLKRDNSLYS